MRSLRKRDRISSAGRTEPQSKRRKIQRKEIKEENGLQSDRKISATRSSGLLNNRINAEDEPEKKEKSDLTSGNVRFKTELLDEEGSTKKDHKKMFSHHDNRRTEGFPATRVQLKSEKSETDSEMDSEDELDARSAFEQKRLKNIQDNYTFFSQLGILQAKEDFSSLSSKKKSKLNSGPRKTTPKDKRSGALPRRQSLRIQNKAPSGEQQLVLPSVPEVTYNEHPRKPSGPLAMNDTLKFGDDDTGSQFISSLQKIIRSDVSIQRSNYTPEEPDYESFTKSVMKMKINEDRVAKVVLDRIFSVAIHPNRTKLIAAAGDKWGKIGFWDVESNDEHQVFMYEPHSRPVNCLKFAMNDASKLYSSSYDGTVRCCDMEKGIFDEVFATSEDEEERCISFDYVGCDTLAVGLGNGELVLKDVRMPGTEATSSYQLYQRVIKSVSVHPVKSHTICTSSNDGMIQLWDTRKINVKKPKPFDSLNAGSRSVSSAYFSPMYGNYILATSMDDRIRIYDSNDLEDIKIKVNKKHDNHVGRWLTSFRATWHPSREDVFVVGSMQRPRQIELYNNQCELVRAFSDVENLTSVCSIVAFHPSRNILVGGNSSGRLFTFM